MTRARSLIIQRHFKVSAIDNLRFFITFYSLFSSVLPVPPPPPPFPLKFLPRHIDRAGAWVPWQKSPPPPDLQLGKQNGHSYTPIQYRHHNKQIYCTVRDCTPGWIDVELFGEFQQCAHSCRSVVILEVPFQKVLSLAARAR